MNTLNQRYPMVFVDELTYNTETEFYIGIKYAGKDSFWEGQQFALSLLLEGMGQTAEFNILNTYFNKNTNIPRLFLAGINEVEIDEVEIDEVEINEVEINKVEIDKVEIDKVEIDEVEINEIEIDEINFNKFLIKYIPVEIKKLGKLFISRVHIYICSKEHMDFIKSGTAVFIHSL